MADYTVLAAWNGSGTALVFETAEARDEMLDLYEPFRKEYSLPWITSKDAIKGEDILELWKLGYRPYNVYVSQDDVPKHAKAIPLHHVGSLPVAERYSNGKIRVLQVWAENEEVAVQYAVKMLTDKSTPLLGYDKDIDFGCNDYEAPDTSHITMPYTGPHRGSSDVLKGATKLTQASIAGFGNVLDISEL